MWQSHNGRVGSPFRADQLSPEMIERYGLDRRPWGTWLAVAATVIAACGAVALVSTSLTRMPIDVQVISWDESATDHVDVEFQVSRPDGIAVDCAVRAQDRIHIDVGYAIVRIPAGAVTVRTTYPLAIIAPSAIAEVLGCAPIGELRVIEPQFPPGVVAPDQPYPG